ncbi:MAG: chemotaxis-specific protein-glutamate methyltransferase CheB [Alphaproteobacteria bacterium]
MNAPPKVRVMIVEDSVVVRTLLEHIIEQDPRLTLIGSAGSGEQALRMLGKVRPDVISMDIRLPGMNGLDTTRRIMSEHPTPIVVVSSAVDDEVLDISMNALRAGALSVVEKPVGTSHADYRSIANHLCTQLFIMSQVKVVRQRRVHAPVTLHRQESASAKTRTRIAVPNRGTHYRMLGVVASTGGPNALAKVLGGLPDNFPLPIAVVQHIGADFLAGFASWLDGVVPLPVSVAGHGQPTRPGHVYVAPPNAHLKVGNGCFYHGDSAPVSGQRPSGSVLFASMAAALGPAAIGVLLTGMGDDGASGLLALRRAGGHTIAEDASTAVVFGMPGVAAEMNAVEEQRPLDEIAPAILALLDRHGGLA